MSSIDRSVGNQLIDQYRLSTNSKEQCRSFLINHARSICRYHSFSTFKELCLNYRIINDRSNKSRIIHDYCKYVLTKTVKHTSNLAISYNMITQIGVDGLLESRIINFMLEHIEDKTLDPYRRISSHVLKRSRVLEWVRINVMERHKLTG